MNRVIRTCVACGAKKDKCDLVRFVLAGAPEEDPKQRRDGRGAYVCDNEKCREIGMKKYRLMRSLQHKLATRDRNTG